MKKVVRELPMGESAQTPLHTAEQLLRDGHLVVIPTETVYGLGANAYDLSAIEKIFTLKGRPPTNPLICHVGTFEALIACIAPSAIEHLSPHLEKLKCFWPGPLTVIVPKEEKIPDIVTASTPNVGLRIPNHPLTLELLKRLPFPVAAPSANRSNYISPTTAEHVRLEYIDNPPFIIDGGPCVVGLESTILSLVDPEHPVIVRTGAISREALEAALSIPVLLDSKNVPLEKKRDAPGQMRTHYSPKTPLRLLKNVTLESLPQSRIGLIAFSADLEQQFDFAAVEVLSENRNLRRIAERLYDALRKLDQLDLELILIDSCEPIGIGAAIMDRINRAARG